MFVFDAIKTYWGYLNCFEMKLNEYLMEKFDVLKEFFQFK